MCCDQVTQLGYIHEDTDLLRDFWNSPVTKEIRDQNLKGILHPVCRSGGTCPFLNSKKNVGPCGNIYENYTHPMHLEISLPDSHCNIGGESPNADNPACIMCRRNFVTPSQDPDLTALLCRKAKPLMPYLVTLAVLGIAEPFWKDKVFEVFDLLEFDNHKDHIQFCTNTNGTCLYRARVDRFLDRVNYSSISWSLDAATPGTFKKIRRLDAFNAIKCNLANFIFSLEHRKIRKNHWVSIYNSINLLNIDEMVTMVEYAAEMEVDELVMLPTFNHCGVADQLGVILLNDTNVGLFSKTADRAMERAQELGVKLKYTKNFHAPPAPMPNLAPIVPDNPTGCEESVDPSVPCPEGEQTSKEHSASRIHL